MQEPHNVLPANAHFPKTIISFRDRSSDATDRPGLENLET